MRILIALAAAGLIAGLTGCVGTRAHDEQNLLLSHDFTQLKPVIWQFSGDVGFQSRIVTSKVGGFTHALQVQIQPGEQVDPWALSLFQKVPGRLQKGEQLQYRLWLRSPESSRLTTVLEEARQPWTKLLEKVIDLTPQWHEYVYEITVDRDYEENGFEAGFHLAHAPGTIEITGVRLLRLTAPATAADESEPAADSEPAEENKKEEAVPPTPDIDDDDPAPAGNAGDGVPS